MRHSHQRNPITLQADGCNFNCWHLTLHVHRVHRQTSLRILATMGGGGGVSRGRAPVVITDATACVGGNTLNFAQHFDRVNAVEIDPQRCARVGYSKQPPQNSVSPMTHRTPLSGCACAGRRCLLTMCNCSVSQGWSQSTVATTRPAICKTSFASRCPSLPMPVTFAPVRPHGHTLLQLLN
eukprot:SAG31_NODE_7586_length_1647_cov_1.270026_3_plen_181_part_00